MTASRKRAVRQQKLPRCVLICVGSELLRGKINTHASTLARRLASIGLRLDAEQTIGDDLPALREAMEQAARESQIILVTGGLGPTFDDVTREAAAEAFDRSLRFSAALEKDIIRKFQRAKYRMPPTNLRQAYVLEGGEPLPNAKGTAPGQWLVLSQNPMRVLILLPGPPHELQPMLEASVLPRLHKVFHGRPQVEAHLHFVGVAESIVDQKIRPIINKELRGRDDIQFTILAHYGLVDFDIFVGSDSHTRAKRILQRIVNNISRCMGDALYGINDGYPLEKVIGDGLLKAGQTLAVAESCTGGLMASRLTQVAGSSAYFLGGTIAYHNSVKTGQIQVPQSLLDKYGAVSRPTAIAMADGVRRTFGANWGLSITGVAGPGGGTTERPVGLVYVAASSGKRTICQEHRFTGDREVVRQRAVLAALDLLRRQLPK